eukprot:scaffold100658_cov72-Phaeocystis_antarctica.AAC.2
MSTGSTQLTLTKLGRLAATRACRHTPSLSPPHPRARSRLFSSPAGKLESPRERARTACLPSPHRSANS